ncbi:MAG TPA: (d)CMP kinase [Bryobacteraceae bacterium]|nr:(d)CMP kinase [Bryobacteraceae bacterium]
MGEMPRHRIVIAIDGPAGAGKSTIARSISAKLGFVHIDSGAMYRAVALWALRAGVALDDMHRLEQLAREASISFPAGGDQVFLNGEDVTSAIRGPEVSAAASKVSAVGAVRRALVEKQREMGELSNVVMEGRDIGSVVFPEARVKIYLDAKPITRAERRTRELLAKGQAADAASTATAMQERDHRDRTRAEAPLVQAPDAVYVDSDGLSLEEVEAAILKIVRERTTNGKEYSQ